MCCHGLEFYLHRTRYLYYYHIKHHKEKSRSITQSTKAFIWSTRERDADYSWRWAMHSCLVLLYWNKSSVSKRTQTLSKMDIVYTATGGIHRERTISNTNQPMGHWVRRNRHATNSKQRSEVVRGSERGLPTLSLQYSHSFQWSLLWLCNWAHITSCNITKMTLATAH